MLQELRIRDFAIIDELDLQFDAGLVVLTGETGAGKSIIVDAVELVLGEWADSTVVRGGAERALVEAVFRLEPGTRARIGSLLEQEGLDGDNPELLLLGREVRPSRRNICRVNGRTVTLALLREVAEGLVDIHGQSEHLSLLRVSEHINLLDRYGDLWALRQRVDEIVHKVNEVRSELRQLRRDERELAHRADLLRFQIDEIESAAVAPDEEKTLREERPRLANGERLTQLVHEAIFALAEGESQGPSAVDSLGTALRSLAEGSRIDGSLRSDLQSAEVISFQIEELVRQLRAYQEQIQYSPERLQEVEDRLSLLGRLKRKYGETMEDVVSYAEGARRELDAITHSDERIVELEADEARLLQALSKDALELSERRREASGQLARAIEEELAHLSMDGARFGMAFAWRPAVEGVPVSSPMPVLGWRVSGTGIEETDHSEDARVPRLDFDRTGIDRVEFLVSANPGEPLKAMTRIASGGETSRLMLALKAVLAQADETPTLVFDEIDQGIGGRVGGTVGEKLWGLAVGRGPSGLKHQVLCVTHLPQLASFGDVHLRVEKLVERQDGQDRTVTRVKTLDAAERVAEVANMLGGSGEAVHRSAEELLEQVAMWKRVRMTNTE